MTATTNERDTQERRGDTEQYPLAAGFASLKGTIAVLQNGYLTAGVTATGLVAVGRFNKSISNASGLAGAMSAPINRGKFRWFNSSGADLITQANVGVDCYIVDNQTVALTSGSGTRSRLGKIMGVEANGDVWVQVGLGL